MNGRLFETRLDDDAAPHGRVIKYLHCHRRSRRLIPELIVFHFIQRLRALPLYGVDKHGVVGSARTLFFLFFFSRNQPRYKSRDFRLFFFLPLLFFFFRFYFKHITVRSVFTVANSLEAFGVRRGFGHKAIEKFPVRRADKTAMGGR